MAEGAGVGVIEHCLESFTVVSLCIGTCGVHYRTDVLRLKSYCFFESKKGFRLLNHSMRLFGTCAACTRKRERAGTAAVPTAAPEP